MGNVDAVGMEDPCLKLICKQFLKIRKTQTHSDTHGVDPSDMLLHRETLHFPPRALIWSMVLEAGTRRVTSPCLSMIHHDSSWSAKLKNHGQGLLEQICFIAI